MAYTATPNLRDIKKKPKYDVRDAKGNIALSPEQEEEFKRLYPITSNKKMMELFGIGFSSVHRIARKFMLEKNMKVIKRKQALQIKRKCEKNGYYDSLRGKPLSEACREGARRRWAEESISEYIKRTMPKVHKKRIQKLATAREKARKKDKRRLELGLPPLTRLNIPLYCYTHSQTSRRYNAIRRGYILGDPSEKFGERYTIYYDDNTNRSARFERNTIADGFTVKRLIN